MRGILGRLVSLPTFLVTSGFAALSGLHLYLTGKQTQLWRRVRRRDTQ